MKLLKNNLEANELRLAGNQHYKSYRFYEALICYNKSICKAIPGSEDFSLAFANRSAVYKEMKEFELCLENVKLAIDCGYPQNKLNVLLERQEKCLDMVDEVFCRTNPWDFFKLSYQNNEEIPFIVDCIELHESKEFGRHLRTNRTLKAGDIICIEEPFHKFIVNSARFTHCLNCLKSQQLNLFPCLKCDIAMFCSKKCMKISQRFHQFECQVIEINEHDDNSIFEMTHRVVQEALGIFSNIEKFQKFIEQNSQLKTIFEMSLTNIDDKKKEKNLLIATNALQRNKIPAEMKSLMDQHVELMRSITKNVKHREFLDEFMRKEMEIVITNTFGLTSPNGNEFGAGIFPLSSFFNHSCSPNVMRITVENKLVFIVSRPIEENEQLFVCYRNDFMETSTESRKAELRTKYNFDCVCEACIENFPLLIDIKSTSLNKISPEKTSTQQFTEQIAKAEFKTNCEFINKNSKNFPNYEVCNLIKRNQSLLEYLANISSSFSW